MRCLYLSPAALSKLAKHLAVLTCLGIVGETSGRFAIGQMGIFLLVVSAALLHTAARTLQRRVQIRSMQTQKGFTTEALSTQSSEYSVIKNYLLCDLSVSAI
jgi:hypothetical protein